MKRFFLLTLFIFSVVLTHAAVLLDVYHQDYGDVDRTVLVFDKKPVYKIIKNESKIQLSFPDCKKAEKVHDEVMAESRVLAGFTYSATDAGVLMTIAVNKDNRLEDGYQYNLKSSELQEKYYKLVLDIFNTNNPQTLSEHLSFADFYEAVGYSKLAEEHLHIAEELKMAAPEVVDEKDSTAVRENESIEKEDAVEDTLSAPVSDGTREAEQIGWFSLRIFILSVIALVVFIAIVVLLRMYNSMNNDSIEPVNESLRSTSGFGREEFRQRMVSKLTQAGWSREAIAKELNLSMEEVERLQNLDENA